MTKPILAICASAMFLLFSCKKDNASSNYGPTTWISGNGTELIIVILYLTEVAFLV
jgi:hypothetical protein